MSNTFEIAKTWLLKNGGHVHEFLERGVDHRGISGIFSNGEISKDDTLVKVPFDLCLTADKFETYEELSDFSMEPLMDKVVAMLLCEKSKGEASRYKAWIDILPTIEEFKSFHPYFCNSIERQQMLELCPRVVETLDKFHCQIQNFMKTTTERFSIDDVEWAYANYLTRAFEGVGLVPFCDLFNHYEPKGMGISDHQELNAKIDIQSGDQVYISYGRNYDSLELWLSFGFMDNEAEDCISCGNLSYSPTNDLEEKVASLLAKNDYQAIEVDGKIIKIKFNNKMNLRPSGASDQLMQACHIMGISHEHELLVETNPLKTLRKLNQIINAFEAEISTEKLDLIANSPLIDTYQEILKNRLELLKKNRSWLKEQSWQIVNS
jgi:hypothetical protein